MTLGLRKFFQRMSQAWYHDCELEYNSAIAAFAWPARSIFSYCIFSVSPSRFRCTMTPKISSHSGHFNGSPENSVDLIFVILLDHHSAGASTCRVVWLAVVSFWLSIDLLRELGLRLLIFYLFWSDDIPYCWNVVLSKCVCFSFTRIDFWRPENDRIKPLRWEKLYNGLKHRSSLWVGAEAFCHL